MAKNSDLNTKLATLETKAGVKVEQDKIWKLQRFHSGYFRGHNFFGNNGFQNIFVYQPTLNALGLKKDKDTEYIVSWKSKGVYNSKLTSLHGAFLPNLK